MSEPHLQSTIVCPYCGAATRETMPVDSCLYFYDCKSCNAVLKPRVGDCCVFCSYGDVRCPAKREEEARRC
ncbi:MAG: hypothetical protein A3E78_04330 [Alphaproteobacteria bacterium RIFCSPHIGHO2_12_FULL_63_12]|nr:MAG: hypothetical protein A3E78_04330 [Alphaproteobacteria bacterium RIFCSPHIGHO2_12_FULL_63_12]